MQILPDKPLQVKDKNKEVFDLIVQVLSKFNLQNVLVENSTNKEIYAGIVGSIVTNVNNWFGEIISNEKNIINWPKIQLSGNGYYLFQQFQNYITNIYIEEFDFSAKKLGELFGGDVVPDNIEELFYVLLLRFSSSILSESNILNPIDNMDYLKESGREIVTTSTALIDTLGNIVDCLCQAKTKKGDSYLITNNKLLLLLRNLEIWFSTFRAYIDRLSRLSEYKTTIKSTEILLIRLEYCLEAHLLATISDINREAVEVSEYRENVLRQKIFKALKQYLQNTGIEFPELSSSSDLLNIKKLHSFLLFLEKNCEQHIVNHIRQLVLNKIAQQVLNKFSELTTIGGWLIFFSGLIQSEGISQLIKYHSNESYKIVSAIGNTPAMSTLVRSVFLDKKRGITHFSVLSCLSWDRLCDIESIKDYIKSQFESCCSVLIENQSILNALVPEGQFTFVNIPLLEGKAITSESILGQQSKLSASAMTDLKEKSSSYNESRNMLLFNEVQIRQNELFESFKSSIDQLENNPQSVLTFVKEIIKINPLGTKYMLKIANEFFKANAHKYAISFLRTTLLNEINKDKFENSKHYYKGFYLLARSYYHDYLWELRKNHNIDTLKETLTHAKDAIKTYLSEYPQDEIAFDVMKRILDDLAALDGKSNSKVISMSTSK